MYIMKCSKRCPSCKHPIQRSSGCCKMHCENCHTSFCWVCMEILSGLDPYKHFNKAGATCQLFEEDKNIGLEKELEFQNDDEGEKKIDKRLTQAALEECGECPKCMTI